ncbi:hypothetical protein FKZ61_021615 [Litorilinea aerophila]|uniref:Uncharacterized protein n=1 Tax=Litorilinea aerophila TaxID=1204385 RepID=A0A540V9R4_9CHLR|nr:hypothetical protein [Litorilinea aerophila]MCC9078697.1 hypothetical protein [Litorilinea aerophila]
MPMKHYMPRRGWPNYLLEVVEQAQPGDTIVVHTTAQQEAIQNLLRNRNIDHIQVQLDSRFHAWVVGDLSNPQEVAERLFRRIRELAGKNVKDEDESPEEGDGSPHS